MSSDHEEYNDNSSNYADRCDWGDERDSFAVRAKDVSAMITAARESYNAYVHLYGTTFHKENYCREKFMAAYCSLYFYFSTTSGVFLDTQLILDVDGLLMCLFDLNESERKIVQSFREFSQRRPKSDGVGDQEECFCRVSLDNFYSTKPTPGEDSNECHQRHNAALALVEILKTTKLKRECTRCFESGLLIWLYMQDKFRDRARYSYALFDALFDRFLYELVVSGCAECTAKYPPMLPSPKKR